MNLLLDTPALIWWDEGRRLPAATRRTIQEAETVYVSAASAWEIAIKTSLGRLRPRRTLAQAIADSGFTELPITIAHAELVASLPPHHRDPFDRILIAQAQSEDVPIVTRDPAFSAYHVRVIAI